MEIAKAVGAALLGLPIRLPAPDYAVAAAERAITPRTDQILPGPVPFLKPRGIDIESINRWTFALHWLGWSGQCPTLITKTWSSLNGNALPMDVPTLLPTDRALAQESNLIRNSELDLVQASIATIRWMIERVDGSSPPETSIDWLNGSLSDLRYALKGCDSRISETKFKAEADKHRDTYEFRSAQHPIGARKYEILIKDKNLYQLAKKRLAKKQGES
jgi:hypothetical protein